MATRHITGTTLAVIVGQASLAAGSFSAGVAFDASTDRMPYLRAELRGTLNTSATDSWVHIYILPLANDGASYPPSPNASWAAYRAGSLPIKPGVAGEQISIATFIPCPPGGKGQVYLQNGDGSVALSGFDLDLTPHGFEDA